MLKRILLPVLTVLMAFQLNARTPSASQDSKEGTNTPVGKKVDGVRKYTLIVNEGNDSVRTAFNRGLAEVRGNMQNRGFADNLIGLYKNTVAGQSVSVTQQLLDVAVGKLANALRSKHPDWERAVMKESTFVRRLPMQMEILDFYAEPSNNGPLDPENMNFNGFGCGQEVEYIDANGEKKKELVFYVSCKMDASPEGKARMLNHSKFHMVVDTLIFNYAICDLPNDSLGTDIETRIPFSFEDRMDLRFNLKAEITSSWINEAMMVFTDQKLGEFEVTAFIEETALDPDGVFRYYAGDPESKDKKVMIKGDCFLVPRSYTGSADPSKDVWGTGQYKVEMQVSESCRINPVAYEKNPGKWKKEWAHMKKRKANRGKTIWQEWLDVVTNQYGNQKWVTVLAEPMKSTFVQYEKEGVNKLLNPGTAAPAGAGAVPGR